MSEKIIECAVLSTFCYPIVPLIAAIVSTTKNKRIWCYSMYGYIVLFTFFLWAMAPIVNGYPIVLYRWYEYLPVYAIIIGAPLFIHLKELQRKTRLILMWAFTFLIPMMIAFVLAVLTNNISV